MGFGPWLSSPSKMPGASWNLPAGSSCPASKLAAKLHGNASTCHKCYAKTGRYGTNVVKAAMQRRFDFVLQSLRDDNGDSFVSTMVAEITRVYRKREPVFRVHDSGDMFSPEYVRCWIRIAQALPHIRFWVPTREWIRPQMLPVLRELHALPNVTVRPSALRRNDPAPVVEGLGPGSAVYDKQEQVPEGTNTCPATGSGEHSCDAHGCRRCWDRDEKPVAYLYHHAGDQFLVNIQKRKAHAA